MRKRLPSAPRTVLVTGCSSGLGLALAKLFYGDERFRFVATARRRSISWLSAQFQETPNFWIRELDVTDEAQIDHLINEVTQKLGGVDVLINNAGILYRSVIEHMDEATEMLQLKTNYLGPMALVRMVLPVMREKGFGHIINISSVSGMLAMPTMGSYSASKHALDGASEALWYEMRPFGIAVSLVQPGFIHSNSFQNVLFPEKAKISDELEGPYADYYSHISPFIERLMKFSVTGPEKIAKKILRLIHKRDPPLWYPATPDARIFSWLRILLPKMVFHKLMYLMLPGSAHWGGRFRRSHTKILQPRPNH